MGAVGDQVAGEKNFLFGHPYHRVALRMAVTEVDDPEKPPTVTDFQAILEGDQGRVDAEIRRVAFQVESVPEVMGTPFVSISGSISRRVNSDPMVTAPRRVW